MKGEGKKEKKGEKEVGKKERREIRRCGTDLGYLSSELPLSNSLPSIYFFADFEKKNMI